MFASALQFSRPSLRELVWKTRDIIIGNLYKFYQAQGIIGLEAVNRITNIMLLLPKIQVLLLVTLLRTVRY